MTSPSLLPFRVSLNSCLRCGGPSSIGGDQYGPDIYCIYCGYRPEAAETIAERKKKSRKTEHKTGKRL